MTHMYYADLEVRYGDGSTGAKRFEGVSLDIVQNQAISKVRELVATSKFAKQMDADKTFEVTGHRISSGKVDV